jgi:Sigma-70, region 4
MDGVDGTRKMTPARQPNFDPLDGEPCSHRVREDEGVLCVEEWAEIRRLHRAEKMPIKVIARVLGCSKNTVKAALARGGASEVFAAAGGVDCGCGGAADSGVVGGVSDDAGDGDRGADWLGAVD